MEKPVPQNSDCPYQNRIQKNQSMRKAFEKITAENTVGLSQSNEVILMDVFSKLNKQGEYVPHLLILTQKFVLYYTNHTKTRVKRLMPVEFCCKFEMLKQMGTKLVGIRFEREGCKPFELLSSETHRLVVWEKELEKHLNKRGFHEEFKPIKKIGKGNFAAVYLATRLSDQARVAVKAFSKQHIFSQQKGRESLINEIKLLRSFHHPNILRLLAVYESLNSVYLVLDLLEGSQLFSVIETHQFTLKEIQDIMKGLLNGVAEMAKKNVVHRDVKPENIMFRTSRINTEICILDFGLATFCDQKEYIYTRCGTPGFVSPQIVNIKDLTTKSRPISDVFSLGIIFHILLLGKSPFKGKTFNEVLSENRQCAFTLQGQEYSSLPPQAYDLLQKMLEKNPNLRLPAQQCLKHTFLVSEGMEIQEFETVVKNPQELRIMGSTVPEDSYGQFFMKKPAGKGKDVADSIQIKDPNIIKGVNSPKLSKFIACKSPTSQPENVPPFR